MGSALAPELRTVKAAAGQVTLVLRSGLQLKLGEARDVALKLAVADRLLRALSADERAKILYLDLTLPSRPVAGTKPGSYKYRLWLNDQMVGRGEVILRDK